MEKKLNQLGMSLDLDNTCEAYYIGGVNKHWTDYSNNDGWDEEKFYNDFNEWWKGLPNEEKARILKELKTYQMI